MKRLLRWLFWYTLGYAALTTWFVKMSGYPFPFTTWTDEIAFFVGSCVVWLTFLHLLNRRKAS